MAKPKYFKLDPVHDHEAIVKWMVVDTWNFDFVRSIEIALLKTFAFPDIAKILVDSGEFLNRTQKRYDDTDLLLSQFIEHGYSSPGGREAIRRINRMHARHPITNEQMLYVLSTFVIEPIRWIQTYGYRPLLTLEKQALFHFWIAVGRLMGIKNLFASLEDMMAAYDLYEQEKMQYSNYNASLYQGVVPFVAKMMPRPWGRLVGWTLPALMPPRMCAAFGVEPKAPMERWMVRSLLRTRAHLARWVPSRPVYRTKISHPTYPDGYTIKQLGV